MDSSARLDYALFQLTPTRTRCDLVVFSGGLNEKLASGLLEPFISHLRCAKEQIPKGGYSITLRAPTANASWFTKGTLERFVRFVSTPEVLERFVTIEREISQIEVSISIQSNELSSTNVAASTDEGIAADVNAKKAIVPFKPKGESNGTDEALQGENSKIRLQRVLETRKVVLRKEQAMAYARAFVAGFEMDYIDDLISFSDAFGASRLREACINFKELCNKKRNDGLWMDELAAVQAFSQPELPYLATSGIILAGDGGLSNGPLDPTGSLDASVSDSTTSHASADINQGHMPPTTANAQGSMPWPNHLPQFMYNFQHPVQQMPPYQGYPFPAMQGVPPYYPRNMQWPPNAEESGHDLSEPDNRRNRKSSSRKKEKSRNEKVSDPSEEEHTEPSDSTSGSEVEHEKKHSSVDQSRKKRNGKKSSRTVVIRNINYITSKRKDGENNGVSDESSSAEDDFIDGTSLKQKVEDAVGSLEKHHKSRRSKKRGGNKNLTVTNDSNGEADQDLEDDAVANTLEGGKTNNNWDSFQNLLMRDDKLGHNEVEKHRALDVRDEYFAIKGPETGSAVVSTHDIDPESEKGIKQRMVATDSFVLTERDAGNERNTHFENFESIGSFRPNMNKRDSPNEELLFSHRIEDSERNSHDTLADCTTELSVLKTQKGEDWFVVNQPEKLMGRASINEHSIFDGDQVLVAQKYNKDSFGDDSFMVQTRSADDQHDYQRRTDLSMISDLTVPSQVETNTPDVSGDNQGVSGKYEPDDLCMVLERDIGVEPTGASWTPEIDYGVDISFTEADKRHSGVETADVIDNNLPSDGKVTDTKNKEGPAKKLSGKEPKPKSVRAPLWKSKHEIISRPKKQSTASRAAVQKSKAEMEEETRKKMEELLIERQKRIAERSSARGLTPATSKTASVESKTPTKQASKLTTQETKRLSLEKPVISSSTIDRLASPQVKHKGSSTPSPKSSQPKKPISKVNGVVATSLSPKISEDENKVTSSEQKVISRTLSSSSSVKEKDRSGGPKTKMQIEPSVSQVAHTSDSIATFQDQKELCDPSSTIMKNGQEKISEQLDCLTNEDDNRETSKVTPALQEEETVNHGSQINGFTTVRMEDHLPPAPENSTAVNLQEEIGATNQTVLVSSEISENEIIPDPVESAVRPTNGVSSDATHSRKKWSSNESSPPVTKGLKKLLMFGRKNISAAS